MSQEQDPSFDNPYQQDPPSTNLDNPYSSLTQPVEKPEELDMFNHNYQRARNILGKRFYVPPNSCDNCFTSIFKHLIHIFLIILLVSLISMAVSIEEIEDKWHEDIDENLVHMQW